VASCGSSNLIGFCRIRLSHRNVGVFRTVWWFLYRRRRRAWELPHVKLHYRRMPSGRCAEADSSHRLPQDVRHVKLRRNQRNVWRSRERGGICGESIRERWRLLVRRAGAVADMQVWSGRPAFQAMTYLSSRRSTCVWLAGRRHIPSDDFTSFSNYAVRVCESSPHLDLTVELLSHSFYDINNQLGKLSFSCRAIKRGFERKSSSSGSTFRNTRPFERSAKAFSSQSSALSGSPKPTYTTAK
jgi:hypothetical protein